MLCEGPTAGISIDDSAFRAERARFLRNRYGVASDRYAEATAQFEAYAWSHRTRVTLWFEYDLFCQVNLLALLARAAQCDATATPEVELVCASPLRGDRADQLGHWSPDDFRIAESEAVPIERKALDRAAEAWKAWCGSDPGRWSEAVVPLAETVPDLPPAAQAHLRRFPSLRDGLSEPQRFLMRSLAETGDTRRAIGRCLREQGCFGFGDLQYERMLEDLQALWVQIDQRAALNAFGEAILAGDERWDPNRAPLRFGGAERAAWRWDESNACLLPAAI